MKEILSPLTARLYLEYLGIGKFDKNFQERLKQVTNSILGGDKRKLSQDFDFLFQKLDASVTGLENIPNQGSLIVIANHFKDGPLKVTWEVMLINNVISHLRQRNDEPRWIIKNALFLPFWPQFKIPLTDKLVQKEAASYDLFLSGKIMPAVRHFQNDGILGLLPEGRNSHTLVRISEQAGRFIQILKKIKPDGVLLPIGARIFGQNLVLNIGQPEFLGNLRKNPDQQVSDFLGIQVATCLPEDLGGFYKIKK